MIKTIKHTALFLLTTFATLVFCELFIGNARIIKPTLGKYYEDIGLGLPTNYEAVFFNEGFGIFKTNSQRFVGREVDSNTINHINIALIGDSFVESYQIFQRDYFGSIIEKKLTERFKGYTFEIQNFGRAGFNLSHNYAYHRLLVDRFEPELVIYFISNEYLHVESLSALYPYTKEVGDSLVASVDFDKSTIESYIFIQDLLDKSILANMLRNAKYITKMRPLGSILFGKVYDYFTTEKKKEVFEKNYVPLPLVNKILRNLESNVILLNRDRLSLYKSFEVEVSNLGIPYWDSSKLVDSLYKIGKDPYYWNVTNVKGHWNQEMQKEIGNYLSDKLIQKIVQDSILVLNN